MAAIIGKLTPVIASFLLLGAASSPVVAQNAAPAQPGSIRYEDFFTPEALRVEIFQVGDAREEFVSLHRLCAEPYWSEHPSALIPSFEMCRYAIRAFDPATHQLIFQRGFDSLFGEYRTTQPALDGHRKVMPKALRMPMPRQPVRVSIERRDNKFALQPLLSFTVDPADYHIFRERAGLGDTLLEIQKTGDPRERVDLVFLSEGYVAEDKDKFQADIARMTGGLWAVEPYKSNREKFNIYGVFRPSPERQMDEPRQNRYRHTLLGASYNTFDTDRYLMIEDNHAVFRMAAAAPHDTIVVLVNTERYGGGGIAMDFCVASVDHATSPRIFVHEFGHSFAFLADEYTGGVAYNDMYPEGVEPMEVNITRLLDRDNIKWKQFLTPGVAIPTPAPARGGRGARGGAGTPASAPAPAPPVVGAFEGAGYLTRGMYRPQLNCIMGTAGPDNSFCAVCRYGIQRMIDFYSPPSPANNP